MFQVPKRKQFKGSVKFSLEFENRDAIVYLLRTRAPLWNSLATRNCVADDWLETLSISGAVVRIELKLHLSFFGRMVYGMPFKAMGIFIRPDVLGICQSYTTSAGD